MTRQQTRKHTFSLGLQVVLFFATKLRSTWFVNTLHHLLIIPSLYMDTSLTNILSPLSTRYKLYHHFKTVWGHMPCKYLRRL